MTLVMNQINVRIPLSHNEIVHAVTDASLTVDEGAVHGLIGESGSGKSMLASTITGMLPRRAQLTGDISLRTKSLNLDSAGLQQGLGRIVGTVPQSVVTALTPVRRIGSQLRETIRHTGSAHSPLSLLDKVGLHEAVLRQYPHELSGGMAQRVAMAFALAGDPVVLIADEPTSALDDERAKVVLDLLAQFASSGGHVLLISHDLSALRKHGLCSDVSVMFASRIVEHGRAERILTAPAHSYTRDLLAALPENGLHPLPHPTPELINLSADFCYGAA